MDRIELFWSMVKKDGPVVRDEIGPCWLWTGTVGTKGYGQFRLNGSMQYAHRVSLMLARGPIPRNRQACHHCDVRLCVRPEHLYVGTSRSNTRDAMLRHRRPVGEKHHAAKLDRGKVIDIRRRHRKGESEQQLARVYGVTQPTISNVILKRTWRHVKEVA